MYLTTPSPSQELSLLLPGNREMKQLCYCWLQAPLHVCLVVVYDAAGYCEIWWKCDAKP
jgi:hypothetical protein